MCKDEKSVELTRRRVFEANGQYAWYLHPMVRFQSKYVILASIFLTYPGVFVCKPETITEVLSHRSSDKTQDKPQNPHLNKVMGESLVMAADRGKGRHISIIDTVLIYSEN